MIGEADTCRRYVEPLLDAAGWDADPHSYTEQVTFTDGRIVVTGSKVRRRPGKRADYLLRFTRDFPIAVVEAKAAYKQPADGLEEAKEYASILDLKFAYGTNGHGIVEFDFLTGLERELERFPTPDELCSSAAPDRCRGRGMQRPRPSLISWPRPSRRAHAPGWPRSRPRTSSSFSWATASDAGC